MELFTLIYSYWNLYKLIHILSKVFKSCFVSLELLDRLLDPTSQLIGITKIHDSRSSDNGSTAHYLRSTQSRQSDLRSIRIGYHFVHQSSALSDWTRISCQNIRHFVCWCQSCTQLSIRLRLTTKSTTQCKNLVINFSTIDRWVDLVLANFEKVRKLLKMLFNFLIG